MRPHSGIPSRGGRRGSGFGRRVLTALVLVALVGAPSASFAGDKATETGREGGLGAAAAISSLIYGPVKLIYATGGLVVGAFAWAFTAGDSQVAEKVFTRSLRGTYVITPDILTGERELVFIGRAVEESVETSESIASASPPNSEEIDEGGYDELGW
ncbi:MAG: hypothetical protein GY910_28855 [bacterium]|nr:hypothetical protein [Deltaproteobacteria bacterium]MCP4909007.1 hypothetical protein [bacterium]